MKEREEKIQKLVSDLIKDGCDSENLSPLKKGETIFDYQVKNLRSDQTSQSSISIQKTERYEPVVKTEAKTQEIPEGSHVYQTTQEGKFQLESQTSLFKDEIQSPSKQELSLFTDSVSQMIKARTQKSQKEELELLLEIKNKELQKKERSLVKSELENERLKKELKWVYQKINFLSQSIKENFKNFSDKKESPEVLDREILDRNVGSK